VFLPGGYHSEEEEKKKETSVLKYVFSLARRLN
jgi:hypothetical protein